MLASLQRRRRASVAPNYAVLRFKYLSLERPVFMVLACRRSHRGHVYVSTTVEVDPDPIFLRDGPVWASAGVTAGMDRVVSSTRLVRTTSERGESGAAHACLRNLTRGRDPVAKVNDTRAKGLCLD